MSLHTICTIAVHHKMKNYQKYIYSDNTKQYF